MKHIPHLELGVLTCGITAGLAVATPNLVGSTVVAWGNDSFGQTNVPFGLNDVVALAGGAEQSLALRSDGTVAAWGGYDLNDGNGTRPMWVPEGLSNVIAIACGGWHNLALRADGTMIAWGYNGEGQTNIPPTLGKTVAVSGSWCSLALQSDGKVVGWGSLRGPGTPPIVVPLSMTNITAISAGGFHNLALRENGRVTGWGDNFYGQLRIPSNLTNAVAIAAGGDHSLALRVDRTVAVWGANYYDQTRIPPNSSNVVAIAGGGLHSMALRSDGTVVSWGYIDRTNVPPGLSNVVAIAGGMMHSLALMGPVSPLTLTVAAPATNDFYFRQTGLMTQRIRLYNTTAFAFPAVRVVAHDLRPDTKVYNLSGTNAEGIPYIQYNQPILPGASIELTLEYFVRNRSLPGGRLASEVVPPYAPPEPTGAVQAITRSLRLPDGSYLIDFRTLANRTYYVQYSPDLTTWKTALPSLTGTGSGVQWVDNGPPKTESRPDTQTTRFYRVLLAP